MTFTDQQLPPTICALDDAGITARLASTFTGIPERLVKSAYTTSRPIGWVLDALELVPVNVVAVKQTSVPALGSVRRVGALALIGWPPGHVADVAGVAHGDVYRILSGRDTFVRVAQAAAIKDAYDALWDRDPTADGISPQRQAQIKEFAAQYPFAPPMAWDDDDLDRVDATTPRAVARAVRLPQSVIVAEADHLAHVGGSLPGDMELAHRLGIHVTTLRKALKGRTVRSLRPAAATEPSSAALAG